MQIYRTWLSGLGTIKGCISQELFFFFFFLINRNPAGIRQKAQREFTGSLNARTTSLREGKGIHWGLGISGTKDTTALPRVSPLHPKSHQHLFGWSFSLRGFNLLLQTVVCTAHGHSPQLLKSPLLCDVCFRLERGCLFQIQLERSMWEFWWEPW